MRRALLWALALGVTVFFGWIAVRNANLDEVRNALRDAELWWVVPSLAVLSVGVLVRALRWQYLFHAQTRPEYGPLLSATLVGLAVNSLLPFRAGEAARIVAVRRRAGTSSVETLATVALERVLDVFCLLLILLLALPWLPEVEWVGFVAAVALALAVLLGGAAVLFAVWGDRPFHALERAVARLPFVKVEWLENAGANLARGLVALREPRLALGARVLTTVSWGFVSVSFWLLTPAFDLDLPVVAGVLILAAVGFSVALPAAPSGIGVFEAATVVALDAYEVPASDALSYAVVLHAANFFPYLLAGGIAVRFTRPPR